ncbi:hypothetical protein MMC09_006539 [Bachmanniomyces sp. S44760]|nr:hypothetical protein [Bachmanniomyces sp. S44760]
MLEASEVAGVSGLQRNAEKDRLNGLIAQATAKYAIKDYNSAAELYSRATELQAELNGEMSSENAELLYSYGRCLYHVAVNNSDVLGSKIAGDKEDTKSAAIGSRTADPNGAVQGLNNGDDSVAEEVVSKVVEEKDGTLDTSSVDITESKPYFQFTGDENFDDSEEENEAESQDEAGEAEGDEDDFTNAYEVLDMARVLLRRKIEETQISNVREASFAVSEATRQSMERLADTHDLQAEISLEGERFPNAVVDLKESLRLKAELFPEDSSLIAEAHYKLSLALEFASVTTQKDANEGSDSTKEAQVDESMRNEAAMEMERAIASCNLRIKREEQTLLEGSREIRCSEVSREGIDDVKEMVKDMEQRLIELRQPPVSISDPKGNGTIDGSNPLSGILGSILGETQEAQKARLEDASTKATDLTNLVKRKRPANNTAESSVVESKSGKRKLDLIEDVEDVDTSKKAHREDTRDP